MKCIQCGSSMKERREDFDYGACGLPVILAKVIVRRCTKCDEHEAVIPMVEALHAAVAEDVIRKKTRLVGAEIRFLRSWLGLSGVRFAKYISVLPETVSRWENDKTKIGETHEKMLRLMAAQRQFFTEYDVRSLLEAEYSRAGRLMTVRAKQIDSGWELEKPAA